MALHWPDLELPPINLHTVPRQEPDSPVYLSGSPCNKSCRQDSTMTYCVSCKRSTDEIRNWNKLDEQERGHILDELPHRIVHGQRNAPSLQKELKQLQEYTENDD